MEDASVYTVATIVTVMVACITYVMSLWITRTAAFVLAKKLYGPKVTMMLPNDYVCTFDNYSNLLQIQSYQIFSGNITAEDLKKVFQEKVLNNERYSRFYERFVKVNGYPFWVEDGDFNMDNHIINMDPKYAPKNMKDLTEYMGRIAAEPLPIDRPLWRFEVINNFNGGQESVLINILHHVIGDGVGIVSMLFDLLDKPLTPVDSAGRPLPTTAKGSDPVKKIFQKKAPNPYVTALRLALTGPFTALSILASLPDNNILHYRKETGGRRHVAVSQVYNIKDIKSIRRHFDVTINDVVMSVLGSTIHRYFKANGEKREIKILNIYVPINLRTTPEPPRLENQFALAFAKLPCHTSDPKENMKFAKTMFDSLKGSMTPLVMYLIGSILGGSYTSENVSRFMVDIVSRKATVLITNVPGPQNARTFSGHTLKNIMFWAPGHGSIGISISIFSYNGQLQIGVSADETCMKDPRPFIDLFDEVFQEVLQYVKATNKNDSTMSESECPTPDYIMSGEI